MQRAPQTSTPADRFLQAQCIDDPWPLFDELREQRPLSRIGESGAHLVASWDLVEEALAREQDFSANLTGVLYRKDNGEPAIFAMPADGAVNVIATADEPDHSLHRSIIQPHFLSPQVNALEADIAGWVEQELDSWLAGGAGDIVPLTERIPARVVAHLLALPQSDVEHFRRWAMMGGDMLAGHIDAGRMAYLAEQTSAMANYLAGHLQAQIDRAADDGSVMASLAQAVGNEQLPFAQALGIAIVLFGAGGESTAALMGSAVKWLAGDTELQSQLRSNHQLIPRFVEEIVRLESPFKFHYRAVQRDCALGGYRLHRGDCLLLAWAAVNRDPDRFDDANCLRLDRAHYRQHMGFGRGAHFCIGALLARAEAKLLIRALLERGSSLQLDSGQPPRYAQSIFIRRLEQLSLLVTIAT